VGLQVAVDLHVEVDQSLDVDSHVGLPADEDAYSEENVLNSGCLRTHHGRLKWPERPEPP
jgi:hypothetical protein